MAATQETRNMALFCDFENVALGVQDAKYEKFDINRVLERLLLKGSIVVKKAYCDWQRYKDFKAGMHGASFELIEIPACAPVGQEFSRHPHGRGRARPLLHQGPRRHLRHHQRRLRFLAAGVQAARERQGGDRRGREELHLRPADRQLRRVHFLRRPGARGRGQAPGGRRSAAKAEAAAGPTAASRRRRGQAAGGVRPGAGDAARP